jgi:predicted transcriptional regulator
MSTESLKDKIWNDNVNQALVLSALGWSNDEVAKRVGLSEADVEKRINGRVDSLRRREQVSEALMEGLAPMYVMVGQQAMQTLMDLTKSEKEHIRLQAASKLGDWTQKFVLAKSAIEKLHSVSTPAVTFTISERANDAVVRELQQRRSG